MLGVRRHGDVQKTRPRELHIEAVLQTLSVPDVSVIIPVRDDVRGLGQCLDALGRQTDAPSYEIVVALDRPSPDVCALVAARDSELRTVRSDGVGPYAARNAAAAASQGSVLAFLDADAVPEPTWLARGHSAVADHGVCGGAVVPIRRLPQSRVEEYDAVMHLRQEDHIAEGFAATANLWVTRTLWDAVGEFDADLHSGGDLQWGQRATTVGHAPVYVPDLVVRHRTRGTVLDLARVQYRISRGWYDLATPARRLRPWDEPALRTGLAWVNQRAGLPAGDLRLLGPHVVAMGARWVGWVSALLTRTVGRGGSRGSGARSGAPR